MKVARIHGDGWVTHTTDWFGPFPSAKRAERYLEERYPNHLHVEIHLLRSPTPRPPKRKRPRGDS